MHILQLLKETPLPDDWDKSVYSPASSFKKKIEYAKEKAKRIGGGSSRVAFEIPYQGKKTVLKVAKNGKGMAQNEQESMAFNDAEMLGVSGIVTVPMIDYDEEGSQPSWIHVAYAPKLKSEKHFERLTGFKLDDLIMYAAKQSGNRSLPQAARREFSKEFSERVWKEDTFAYEFVSFVGNTEAHLPDLTRYSNWGVYNNNPVIIDLGLNEDVYIQHYS